MATWKKAKDNLMNGAILGLFTGTAIVYGTKILGWIEGIIPESIRYLGEWSIPVYVILGFGLIGYALDRY